MIIRNKEIVGFLSEVVNTLSTECDNYYQILSVESDKPYVVHRKTNQITAVLSGKGRVIVDGKASSITANDIVLIRKDEGHTFICDAGELVLFHIHIPFAYIMNDRFVLNSDYSQVNFDDEDNEDDSK